MAILTSIDDAALDAEFHFWKAHFVSAIWTALAFAIITGVLIACWPAGMGDVQFRAFVREVWPPFAEFALWFGFLMGLLWAAARRIGCALAGTVPWEKPKDARSSVAHRFLGQAACCLAFGAASLWMAQQFVVHMDGDHSALLRMLTQAVHTGFALAGIAGVLTIGARVMREHG